MIDFLLGVICGIGATLVFAWYLSNKPKKTPEPTFAYTAAGGSERLDAFNARILRDALKRYEVKPNDEAQATRRRHFVRIATGTRRTPIQIPGSTGVKSAVQSFDLFSFALRGARRQRRAAATTSHLVGRFDSSIAQRHCQPKPAYTPGNECRQSGSLRLLRKSPSV
jgi:hypothetical protein